MSTATSQPSPADAVDAEPAVEPDGSGTEVVAIRYRTRVGPGGRISLHSPHFKEGEHVVVEIDVPAAGGRSGLEIIESLGGHRLFKTAEEVDAYLAEERASWER